MMMMMMEKEKETSFKSYRIEIPIKTIAHLEYLRCQYSRDLFKKKLYQIFDIADFNNDRDNQLCITPFPYFPYNSRIIRKQKDQSS